MSTELESKIKASLVNSRLPCPAAFRIAREMNVTLREIGETVDRLEIKVSDCQLGLFSKPKEH